MSCRKRLSLALAFISISAAAVLSPAVSLGQGVPPASDPGCEEWAYGCPGGPGSDGEDDNDNNTWHPPHHDQQPADHPGGYTPATAVLAAYSTGGGGYVTVTVQQAAEKAAKRIVDEYVKELYKDLPNVGFSFPGMARDKQLEQLVKLESKTIKLAEKQIQECISKLKEMKWDTPADNKRRKQIIKNDEKAVKAWEKAALEQAKTNNNFIDMTSYPSVGWLFHPNGDAYYQLSSALQGQEWYK